ncbi:MAG: GNAT family N-acetyltransferase [Ignisphaera sp.]
MEITECNRNCSKQVGDVLEKTMSWFHSYYALSCIDLGLCRAVIAYDNGVSGVGVFYAIPRLSIGVIYYVAVLPRSRGRGIGKAIVASIEELLSYDNVEVFVATTRSNNLASRSMLRDLGYIEVVLGELDNEIEELITMMTCGYEDDVLYIKLSSVNLREFFSALLRPNSINIIEDTWRKICYNPWIKLRTR